MSNYYDEFGRLHNKPVTKENPMPSNNAYFYSGQYEAMTKKRIRNLIIPQCIPKDIKIERHPKEYMTPKVPPISRDELIGLNILYAPGHKKELFLKLKHNNWCFTIRGKPFWHLYWIPLALWDLFKIRNKHRNEIWQKEDKYKWGKQLAFRLAPHDVYYFKKSNNVKHNFFEQVMFIVYVLYTSKKGTNSEKNVCTTQLYHLGLKDAANKYFDVFDELKKHLPEDHPTIVSFKKEK